MAVAIVTDSAADISAEQARELNIDVVPLWVVFGNERLRDGIDLTRGTFYERLRASKELPRTEPLDEAGFTAIFTKHVERGHQCVVPLVSGKLSKTYENARAAAAPFGSQVHVVDSLTLSGGLLLQALAAAEMARAGAGAADIVQALERARGSQRAHVIMPDLTYLGRSGRLNKAIVALGTVLKVSPILQIKDGAVETAGQTRTYEKAQELVVEIATRQIEDVTKMRFAIGHSAAPELAERIALAVRTKLDIPAKTFIIHEIGPTIAVNAGPGGLGIFSIAGI